MFLVPFPHRETVFFLSDLPKLLTPSNPAAPSNRAAWALVLCSRSAAHMSSTPASSQPALDVHLSSWKVISHLAPSVFTAPCPPSHTHTHTHTHHTHLLLFSLLVIKSPVVFALGGNSQSIHCTERLASWVPRSHCTGDFTESQDPLHWVALLVESQNPLRWVTLFTQHS